MLSKRPEVTADSVERATGRVPPSPYRRLKGASPLPALDARPIPAATATATTTPTATTAGVEASTRPPVSRPGRVTGASPGDAKRRPETGERPAELRRPSASASVSASSAAPRAGLSSGEMTGQSTRSCESDETMVRPRRLRPHDGWRAFAYDATGGWWNPGLSAKEYDRRRREERIAVQLKGRHVTAFFCLKGGISKTSTTAATSIALSDLRPDPVFAIDANPDAGDLVERLLGRQVSGISDLAGSVEQIGSLEDLSRYTVTVGRLTVLPGEPNPTLGNSLSAQDFERIMAVVRRYYSFVQVDCGTGVTHPLMSGILHHTDTAVIPAAWSITGARRAAETIRWLAENGFEHLARTSIVVLTAKDVVSANVDKEAVLRHLGAAGDLVVVPADRHVADGAKLEWDLLEPSTREAYLEIAAAITSRFESP